LRVDEVQVGPSYVSSGSYTSCQLDAGVGNEWQTLSWDASLPASTGVTVETRASVDGVVWSGWSSVGSSGSGLGVAGRYAQYRLQLSTSNTQTTPLINAVSLNYGSASLGEAALTGQNNAARAPFELYLPFILK
jgi:hypothetical protein